MVADGMTERTLKDPLEATTETIRNMRWDSSMLLDAYYHPPHIHIFLIISEFPPFNYTSILINIFAPPKMYHLWLIN